MPSSFWVASTKPEAALVRSQGWTPWQGRGWTLAPCDRGPEADMYRLEGHYYVSCCRFGAYFDGHLVTSVPDTPTKVPLRSDPSSAMSRPGLKRSGTDPSYVTGT